jgi:hypothetical protein
MNDEDLIKMQERLRVVKESTDRLSQENDRFWNSILTINGIFMSFLAVLATTNRIGRIYLVIAGALTSFSILNVLYKYFILSKFSARTFELVYQNYLITNPKTDENYKKHKEEIRRWTILNARIQRFTDPAAILCTVLAVVLQFVIIIFCDI